MPYQPTPSQPQQPALLALSRRQSLQRLAAAGLGWATLGLPLPGMALPSRTLQFPRDFGSHPDLQTEWWYITGQLQAGGKPWGFQLTFFRSRIEAAQGLQSALAAKQLIFAHAALCDVEGQKLRHDQRMARAGLGLAGASENDTDVHINDWYLQRRPVPGRNASEASRYRALLSSQDFILDLEFDSTQPLLLQGLNGLSRKGPREEQASYYYSQPQLKVGGSITVDGQQLPVQASAHNRAWLDHECSAAIMDPEAQGWDWIGMNLDDGSALTAFHLRRRNGSALWAGGSFRAPNQSAHIFAADQVRFKPLRHWSSPHSKASYPVAWSVQTPAGRFEVYALLDDQELDSRASTGAIYWEGLCELRSIGADGKSVRVGSGYLEMTGYANALRL
ncbi:MULTISPECIES: lipocalin-like domain-containing protein [Comamonas]|uniref:lipocalin-like domain-containing protein n=1 Tax=Comamonas thiooxydans TaxID=363952 RepID=UPI0021158C16|nr:carotenoid 1,2-hydratase [Comamonas thiooxydans]UUE93921.1 carotenoid 1,2-hydratase [Comamonas thiooxydans]